MLHALVPGIQMRVDVRDAFSDPPVWVGCSFVRHDASLPWPRIVVRVEVAADHPWSRHGGVDLTCDAAAWAWQVLSSPAQQGS